MQSEHPNWNQFESQHIEQVIGSEEPKPLVSTASFLDSPLLPFRIDFLSDSFQDSPVEEASSRDLPSNETVLTRTKSAPGQMQRKSKKQIPGLNPNPLQNDDFEECFGQILKERVFTKKNNNTVRFLVDLAIESLPKYIESFTEGEKQAILQICSQEKAWHLSEKKNVYNVEHLKLLFTQNHRQPNARKTREVFSEILRKESLNFMKRPKSQIQDKSHYLRCAKIYSIRCRTVELIIRNQCR